MFSDKLMNELCGFKVKELMIDMKHRIHFQPVSGKHSYCNVGREISNWLHWDNNGYGSYHYTSFLEFMHACKQWALKQNYSILTVPILEESEDLESIYWSVQVKVYSNEDEFIYFSSNEKSTEYEAVFEACEFILTALAARDEEDKKLSNRFTRQFYDEFQSLTIKDPTHLEESRRKVLERYWIQNMKIAEDTNGIACTVENIRCDIKHAIENDYKVNMIFNGACLQCVGPQTYGVEYCEECGYFSHDFCQDKCIKDN